MGTSREEQGVLLVSSKHWSYQAAGCKPQAVFSYDAGTRTMPHRSASPWWPLSPAVGLVAEGAPSATRCRWEQGVQGDPPQKKAGQATKSSTAVWLASLLCGDEGCQGAGPSETEGCQYCCLLLRQHLRVELVEPFPDFVP